MVQWVSASLRGESAYVGLDSLVRFPNLRRLRLQRDCFPPLRFHFPVQSLSSLRQLTRVSVFSLQLSILEQRLLFSLPALASFTAQSVSLETASQETVQEWLTLRGERLDSARSESGRADLQAHPGASDANKVNIADNMHLIALLLFIHALAAKPSLVRLRLGECYLSQFAMDHMPVWPHLLCLSVDKTASYATIRSTMPLPVSLR